MLTISLSPLSLSLSLSLSQEKGTPRYNDINIAYKIKMRNSGIHNMLNNTSIFGLLSVQFGFLRHFSFPKKKSFCFYQMTSYGNLNKCTLFYGLKIEIKTPLYMQCFHHLNDFQSSIFSKNCCLLISFILNINIWVSLINFNHLHLIKCVNLQL